MNEAVCCDRLKLWNDSCFCFSIFASRFCEAIGWFQDFLQNRPSVAPREAYVQELPFVQIIHQFVCFFCVFFCGVGGWFGISQCMNLNETNIVGSIFFFQSLKKQPTRSLPTPSESLKTSKWFESSRTWWQGKSLEKAVLWWIWYHGCYQDQSWKWMDKNDKKIRIRNRHCLHRVWSGQIFVCLCVQGNSYWRFPTQWSFGRYPAPWQRSPKNEIRNSHNYSNWNYHLKH